MIIQPILDIASICFLKGIRDVVFSPGSRSAPIVLAFVRHGGFQTYTISDERSAAFISLGIAEKKKKPVVLFCTSGTAVLNFAPAIAEAYYKNIPLLVLTADRPPEWIHQQDGQSINQHNVYTNYIKKSYTFPDSYHHTDSLWYAHYIINDALNICISDSSPVHINIPIREPFYPHRTEVFSYSETIKIITEETTQKTLTASQISFLQKNICDASQKIMILIGQCSEMPIYLEECVHKLGAVVITDITSNAHTLINTITHAELFIEKEPHTYIPDIIISFGLSILSKKIKLFLRKNAHLIKQHWHIQETGSVADTFQTLTHIIRVAPSYFFETISNMNFPPSTSSAYQKMFVEKQKKIHHTIYNTLKKSDFNEINALAFLLSHIQGKYNLHLANSMSVRLVHLISMDISDQITVFANRGTSGIDGCMSTAVGISLASPDEQNILIIGDIAFFYDINAFWNEYIPKNLKIIMLNNHGGQIFRIIPESSDLKELEPYFETTQSKTAKKICEHFEMNYFHITDTESLHLQIPLFLKKKNTSVCEIETNKIINAEVYKTILNI
ncbi:MAG: 2-succinyl-5-enolpyruvyl-6-hydroxy-3-cyclohexene-1-carboxylic-acid synthase [Chitinophagaceae bacterium]|nr:2-succinyl-5-enolpyruvyl-6-hydroxy-3-cyclohexene-1-carboxylic-acid synthase [Chitinophagaceae bacterium]